MRSGVLQQIADPEQLYSRPVNDFVADFVGVTNRLPAGSRGDRPRSSAARLSCSPARRAAVRDRPGPPEHLSIDRTDANSTVVSASFLGSHGKVVVAPDAAPGTTLVVQVRSAEVTTYAPGDRVCVATDRCGGPRGPAE